MAVIDNIKNTEIRQSKIHGKGLFATADISKNTLLCVLEGQIISVSDYNEILSSKIYSDYSFVEKYKIDDEYFGAMALRTKYSFINHSDVSNVYSVVKKKKLYVFAKEKILLGEEILDTYNLKKHIDMLGGFKESMLLGFLSS